MDPPESDLSSPGSDAPLGDDEGPRSDVHPTIASGEAPSRVSDKDLRDMVAQPSFQDSIRRIVGARVERGAPPALIDDLVQEAILAMLTAKSPPTSMETAPGWASTVTVRTVANHYRRDETHRTWLEPEADVEEQPGEPEDAPEDEWLISPWLAPILEHHPADKETYELVVLKARTGKTYADVAADHGITTAALKSRVHEFKKKYEPRWRRRQAMFVLLILFGAAAVAVALWFVWSLTRPEEIGPDPSPPLRRAVPSATASATDTPFEPSRPPVQTPEEDPLGKAPVPRKR